MFTLHLVSVSCRSFWNRRLISAGPRDAIISATLGPCCRSEGNRNVRVSEVTEQTAANAITNSFSFPQLRNVTVVTDSL